MMRWTPETVAESSEARDAVVGRDLIDAVVASVAGLGARSVVFAVMVALIVLTLAFGLSTQEAFAAAGWCPKC